MSAESSLIGDRYRLERVVGRGAMGVVWQARDERLGRVVAVKQLLLSPGLTPAEAAAARDRAAREGRIAARLQHQHAVAVYDTAEHDGQPCLIMEYLPSRSLSTIVAEDGAQSPREVARIGAQIASGLAVAHAAGVVHRDIKPGNVLLGDDGIAKISDFGVAHASGDVTVTQTGMLAGTPAYLAPETAKGREPDFRSDVFAFGATLYAAVEGRPPFGTSDNTLALLYRVAEGQIDQPHQAGELTPVLLSLLAVEPDSRPTMAQAAEGLHAVAIGAAPPASTAPEDAATAVLPSTGTPPTGTSGTGTPPAGVAAATRTDSRGAAAAVAGPAGGADGDTPTRAKPWRRIAMWSGAGALVLVVAGAMIFSLLSGPSSGQQPVPAVDSSVAPTPTSQRPMSTYEEPIATTVPPPQQGGGSAPRTATQDDDYQPAPMPPPSSIAPPPEDTYEPPPATTTREPDEPPSDDQPTDTTTTTDQPTLPTATFDPG